MIIHFNVYNAYACRKNVVRSAIKREIRTCWRFIGVQMNKRYNQNEKQSAELVLMIPIG